MKFISYLSLTAACLAQVSSAYSADADLISLIKEARHASAIVVYLEPSAMPPHATDVERRTLKPISAFGGVFDGEVTFRVETQNETRLWTKEPLLSPQAASELFDKVASSLKSELGQGWTVANIPNYGDASDVKSTAVLWFIGTEVILLHLERYPWRGGIGVVRCSGESWHNSMGADESNFWTQTLSSIANEESRADTQAKQAPGKAINAPITTHSPSRSAPEVKPALSPGDGPASSTPWSIIVALIMAVISLLWLLVKRRN
jgi:hypothetical protein